MRLGIRIATRFLKSNKGQTLLIILGIAIGVSVQVFIGSLIQGLQKSLVEKTIGSSSQITISAKQKDELITDYLELMDTINENSNITASTVTSDHAAFLQYKEFSQSLLVRGFDLDEADKIYDLKDRMVEGKLPVHENEIILGAALKNEYGIQLNDSVTITTTNQKVIEGKVVGFFDLKVTSLNTGWGITTLAGAQNIFDTGDRITSIEMQVEDDKIFSTDAIADDIRTALNQQGLKFTNWKEANESLLSGLQGQSISSYMIQVFVMISVILGIASVLAITVMQKSKQIGILKAMGIRNSLTSFIFLMEGLILGVFGAVLGILFGLGLSMAFTTFAVNADGTPVVELFINHSFIILSGCIAVAASIMAALLPAIRSSRLNPIDIIRNN